MSDRREERYYESDQDPLDIPPTPAGEPPTPPTPPIVPVPVPAVITPRSWDHWMGPVIGVVVIVIYAMALAASFMWGNESLQVQMTTSVIPITMMVISFYYGSSAGSQKKDETLATQLRPPVVQERERDGA